MGQRTLSPQGEEVEGEVPSSGKNGTLSLPLSLLFRVLSLITRLLYAHVTTMTESRLPAVYWFGTGSDCEPGHVER